MSSNGVKIPKKLLFKTFLVIFALLTIIHITIAYEVDVVMAVEFNSLRAGLKSTKLQVSPYIMSKIIFKYLSCKNWAFVLRSYLSCQSCKRIEIHLAEDGGIY